MTLTALSNLPPGAEVTICYVDRAATVQQRRAILQDHYEFECKCVLFAPFPLPPFVGCCCGIWMDGWMDGCLWYVLCRLVSDCALDIAVSAPSWAATAGRGVIGGGDVRPAANVRRLLGLLRQVRTLRPRAPRVSTERQQGPALVCVEVAVVGVGDPNCCRRACCCN